MLIQTVFVCSCGDRVLWDTEHQCYLKHEHEKTTKN